MKRFFAGRQGRDTEPEENEGRDAGSAVGPTLYVPRAIISSTYQHLVPYWKARVEAVCFWFGVEAGNAQVVTTLALPEETAPIIMHRIGGVSLAERLCTMKSRNLSNSPQTANQSALPTLHVGLSGASIRRFFCQPWLRP